MATQPPPPPPPPPPAEGGVSSESRMFGLIAWILGIVGAIIALLLKPNDRFVKFHATQSLVFSIGLIVVYIIFIALAHIPYIGLLFGILSPLIWLLGIVVAIVGAIKAYQGEWFKVPLVYDIASKLGI
ncbi:MAG TPA: DUF4870 domain-containing protein [Thermoprotei archaeon]|nr:MAG: hypothetical protein DRJ49_04780 [Thermoprotei archaeon]HDI75601.1 DUF4870 domain-containing protein [Thermoprotei archaeon]